MGSSGLLGEFERLVLLAVLQQGDDGYALGIRRTLEEGTERSVSRGALYRTLDRLEEKGLVSWELEEATPDQGGHPRRRFRVTGEGIVALRYARSVFVKLSSGLDDVLEPGS